MDISAAGIYVLVTLALASALVTSWFLVPLAVITIFVVFVSAR